MLSSHLVKALIHSWTELLSCILMWLRLSLWTKHYPMRRFGTRLSCHTLCRHPRGCLRSLLFFFTDGPRQIWGGFAVRHSCWWPPSVKAGHTVAVAPPVVLASCLLSGFVFISPTFVCEKPILNTLPCFRNWLGKGLVIQAIDHLRGTSPSVYCFYVGEDSLPWTFGLKSGTKCREVLFKGKSQNVWFQLA